MGRGGVVRCVAGAVRLRRCYNAGMSATSSEPLYTRHFAQVFVAVLLFMTAVALQFHFGQYVEYLGHGVDTLGRVLSISMIGTLLLRLQIGRWIDRWGGRPVWLVGAAVFTVATGALQFCTRLWLIVVLRTVAAMSMASVMTTVAVFAAHLAPPRRRAESIGMMGLAGLVGIMIGPTVGDLIFSHNTATAQPYRIFFSASALCSILSMVVMWSLRTRGPIQRPPHTPVQAPPARWRRFAAGWPGSVMLIGLVFSMVFCIQSLFLERLAEARGFQEIKLFYLIYCPTAIALRIIFRRLPEQIGRSRTVLAGMLLLAAGLIALTGVRAQWQLLLPGLLMGAGHCFVFPSMVDLAAGRLPDSARGMGTSLILGSGDLGMLIGFAALGELIEQLGFDAALMVLAGAVCFAALVFAVRRRHAVFVRRQSGQRLT